MSIAQPVDGAEPAATSAASASVGRPALGAVARAGSANLVGAVLLGACNFVLTVAVTRSLTTEQAGIFFSATSIFVLATTVGQLGTDTGLVYFVSRLRSLGRQREIGAYYSTALRPVAVVAVVMTVLTLALAYPLARVFTPGHEHETAPYLYVLALFVPFAGWETVTLAATRGLSSMRPSVVVEQIFRPVLQLGLMLLVLLVVPRSVPMAFAWAGPYLPAAVLGFLWWRKLARQALARSADPEPAVDTEPKELTRSQRRELRDAQNAPRMFWRFTAPRAMASVGQIAMQRLDILLVAALAGPVQAAIYTATTRFLVVGQMGNRAISTAVQPRLGHSLARHEIDHANHYYRTSTAWLMCVTWPIYLIFLVFGSVLLRVFGSGYHAGTGVLVTLSFSMLFATSCGMVDMVLNMAGRTSWNLLNVLLSVGVQFVLCLVLIPRMGILGAAIAWAAAIATGNLAALLQVGLVLGLHPFGRAPAAAAGLSVVCFLVVAGTGRILMGATLTGLLVSGTVACLLYAAGLWLLREPLELSALLVAVRRRRRRTAGEGLSSSAEGGPAAARDGR